MRARLKSGSFHVRFPKTRVYNKGDVIDDIEKVPVPFRDRWEVLPPTPSRDIPAMVKKEELVKEEPKVTVKEEPAIKEELPKKKTTRKPRTTTKKTSSRRKKKKKK